MTSVAKFLLDYYNFPTTFFLIDSEFLMLPFSSLFHQIHIKRNGGAPDIGIGTHPAASILISREPDICNIDNITTSFSIIAQYLKIFPAPQ